MQKESQEDLWITEMAGLGNRVDESAINWQEKKRRFVTSWYVSTIFIIPTTCHPEWHVPRRTTASSKQVCLYSQPFPAPTPPGGPLQHY